MEIIGVIFLVVVVFSAGMLLREYQHMRETIKALKDENAGLKTRVQAAAKGVAVETKKGK